MAIKVVEDIINGSQLTIEKGSGVTDVMRWKVSGLTPGPGIRIQAAYAVDSVTGARPARYGELHPAIGGLSVATIQVTPFLNSHDGCYVVATYKDGAAGGGAGGFNVSITGTTGTKNLQLDSKGVPLTIPYLDKSKKPPEKLQDYVSIPVFTPGTVLCFTFTSLKNLYQMAKSLRARVNDGPFQGEAKHAWMCRRFDISTVGALRPSGPSQWNVNVEFELDTTANGVLTGWARYETFRYLDSGRVPTDIDPSKNPVTQVAGKLVVANGYGVYAPDEADFSVIGLPDITQLQ